MNDKNLNETKLGKEEEMLPTFNLIEDYMVNMEGMAKAGITAYFFSRETDSKTSELLLLLSSLFFMVAKIPKRVETYKYSNLKVVFLAIISYF